MNFHDLVGVKNTLAAMNLSWRVGLEYEVNADAPIREVMDSVSLMHGVRAAI